MKKFLAILLMLSMFMAMLVIPTAAEDEAAAEVADTFNPYDENPTISTASDYINFFHEVFTNKTNTYAGKTITLMNDIVINDTSAEDWYAKDDAYKFIPSKENWSDFNGIFDGNGHTIKGIIIYGSNWRSDRPCGIFPCVSGATIKNLTIDGFYVYSATDKPRFPLFGRAGIGSLVGSAIGDLYIDNCTLKNGIVTAAEGAYGAIGGVVGQWYGALTADEIAAGKTLTAAITNTTVEESVKLVKGNSNVAYMGGIFGYIEGAYNMNESVIDLSASKIQPSNAMDAENPLEPIGKFRFKGDVGASFNIVNVSTAYDEPIEMAVEGAVIDEDQFGVDGWGQDCNISYIDFTDKYNEAFMATKCYGTDYQELKSYRVTWEVDGKTSTEIYLQGATPSYKESTDKPMTDTKIYEFKGWSPELAPVTADVTYTAQYEEYDKVKVTWIVDGKETVEYYKKGDMPNFKGETTKEQDDDHVYTFKGWDTDIVAAETDVTYTAQYEVKGKFKITWVIDGKETVESYLEGVKPSYKGKQPSKAEDDDYTYTFKGWDKELVAVSENATYTAVFDKTAKNGAATDEGGKESGGCGSSISVGFVSLMMIGMAGAFAFRKKHD